MLSTKPNENTVMKPETAEITSAPSISMQPDAGKENATDTVDQTDVPTQQTEDDKKRESSEAMILTVRNGSYAIASDFSGFDIEARYTEKVDESKL